MNRDGFWELIDSVHQGSGGDMDRKCALLKERLQELDEKELRDFIDRFDAADAAAYTWPLWGAAHVMHGGCSDDSFSDFRATLISLGRETYEAALADPESLAALDLEDLEELCYEGYQYVKNDVAEERFGELPERSVPFPEEPAGEEWDEGGVRGLYPRLSAKFDRGAEGEPGGSPKKPFWKFW